MHIALQLCALRPGLVDLAPHCAKNSFQMTAFALLAIVIQLLAPTSAIRKELLDKGLADAHEATLSYP